MGDLGRRGKRYLRLCAQVRARQDPCALCGQPIDYLAQPRTRWSFSLDHELSLVHGGAVLDPNNARAAHYGCNARRGGGTRRNRPESPGGSPPPYPTSRRW